VAGGQEQPPPGLRRARFAPAGRAVGGLVLLVALAVVTALVALWLARPRERPVPTRLAPVGAPLAAETLAPAPADGPAPTGTSEAAEVLVHVAGAVQRPGVVELPAGSRVADAVEAAGGVTRRAAAASVNLARAVVDGEQVLVLRRGDQAAVQPPAGSPGSPSSGSTPSGPVDLNTATLDQLDGLPGIGPVLAQRILDWRSANVRFSSVEELAEVSGIGEATLADLRPAVRV
jgi:competence protein ComEA